MKGYRGYKAKDWSRRLLDHYFGAVSGEWQMVTSLLVTPEELYRFDI